MSKPRKPRLQITSELNKLKERPRDTRQPVMLVGFLDQGNLGLGYLSSTLRRYGYRVIIADVECHPNEVLKIARREQPILIGFSMIFQFYVTRYDRMLRRLRRNGVGCHFTMGGHFPSLSHEETLRLLPALDSVARFEGELTLLHLVDLISTGGNWRDVPGIAFDEDGGVTVTPPDVYLHDLDWLPYPERDYEPEIVLGRKAMPLLASRGCARTCSFCSIHTFYRAAPGKVVRTRKPARVVEEMRYLHDARGVSIFLFQDDDFPLFGPVWRRWARDFVAELHRAELPGHCVWKMNCRADAVEPELFKEMKEAGLYLVYMGLESGSEEGLKTLNKGITVEQNLRAVSILKELGLTFEFGFMLFDPSSTFAAVRDNLRFLKAISNDGTVAAVFCRMLPYDGTPIKVELERTGRLKGDVCNPDYDFFDPELDAFYARLNDILHVAGWIHGHRALSPQLNWAWNEVAIMDNLFPSLPGLSQYRNDLAALTQASNGLLFQVVDDLIAEFTDNRHPDWSAASLDRRCEDYAKQLLGLRDAFVLRNQHRLVGALDTEPATATG